MKATHSFLQGSPEWHQHRAKFFGASDAPAMMGVSAYKTRNQLLAEKAGGSTKEIDSGTQYLFDKGHEYEAIARPWADEIAEDEFFPVTMSAIIDGLPLSASMDGITMGEDCLFEHKTLNQKIVANFAANEIDMQYKVQMEQQLLISGAKRCLFMASAGDLDAALHTWYESDPKIRADLIAGWKQFAADLANYQHVESPPEVVASPVMQLPALSIQVNGSISLIDNLELFGRKLTDFISSLPAKPATDQEFADADAAVKTLKTAEEALDAAESSALAQTASIDQMRRTVGLYRDQARTARLMLDKLVKARKESIRIEIVTEASKALADHIDGLNARIGKPWMPAAHGDFTGAIKGKKLLTALRSACADELARCKIEANEIADRIQTNLSSLNDLAKDHKFLFADAQALATTKANDDLVLVIRSRIADHLAAEAKREEETRQRIRAEEEAKATAKAKAEQDEAERQRKAAEAAATKIVSDRAYNAIMEEHRTLEAARAATEPTHQPAPRPTGADRLDETADAVGITGSGRLIDRLGDLARRMTERELSDLCIHAEHILAEQKTVLASTRDPDLAGAM